MRSCEDLGRGNEGLYVSVSEGSQLGHFVSEE